MPDICETSPKTGFQYLVLIIKVTLNAIKEEIVLGQQRAQ